MFRLLSRIDFFIIRGHLEKVTSSSRFGGEGDLCLTFCDRKTTLALCCMYDTFCVENCVCGGGG